MDSLPALLVKRDADVFSLACGTWEYVRMLRRSSWFGVLSSCCCGEPGTSNARAMTSVYLWHVGRSLPKSMGQGEP